MTWNLHHAMTLFSSHLYSLWSWLFSFKIQTDLPWCEWERKVWCQFSFQSFSASLCEDIRICFACDFPIAFAQSSVIPEGKQDLCFVIFRTVLELLAVWTGNYIYASCTAVLREETVLKVFAVQKAHLFVHNFLFIALKVIFLLLRGGQAVAY